MKFLRKLMDFLRKFKKNKIIEDKIIENPIIENPIIEVEDVIIENGIIVKKFNNKNNNSEIALLEFKGDIAEKIITELKNNFQSHGEYITNGGKASPKSILPLISVGASSIGLSGLASGQLFMATANPATLMAIGNGVGSAVMGAHGIIGQAPFLPVAGAIMPVVAPLIAFQTISTITIMNEFKKINMKLNNIWGLIYRQIQREEATHIGKIISASVRLDDIESQFARNNHFTNYMLTSLALLEDNINSLLFRYQNLVFSQSINTYSSIDDLNFKKNDAYLYILTSILDMRIDLLKLKVNIQEDPGYLYYSAIRFRESIASHEANWRKIESSSSEIQEISNAMKGTINSMNWWQRKMPEWLFGKRNERQETESRIEMFDNESQNFNNLLSPNIAGAKIIGEAIKNNLPDNKTGITYWKDELGEHCFYTDNLLIEEEQPITLNTSLYGYWNCGALGVSINGSTGVIKQINTSYMDALWKDAVSKDFYKFYDTYYSNITKTGDLTWTGQVRGITLDDSAPNVVIGTQWINCTFTMNANGQTFSDGYNTWTRQYEEEDYE